ncbi:MAG: universal stress protein, partial [Owenweeksia sp.]
MLQKPFQTIATAVAFSPNLEANIAESLRIRDCLGHKLLLIHIGERTSEDQEKLEQALTRLGVD